MKFAYGSICISDIPKFLFKTANNGKIYFNIVVSERKEKSEWGDTHLIIASVPKEMRKEDDKPIFCGGLKEHTVQEQPSREDIEKPPVADVDDLPF